MDILISNLPSIFFWLWEVVKLKIHKYAYLRFFSLTPSQSCKLILTALGTFKFFYILTLLIYLTPLEYSWISVWINLNAKYGMILIIYKLNFIKDNSICFTFVAYQFLFCLMNKFEYICWNLTVQINVQIYSRGKKILKWMSQYICFEKVHKYLGKWIYL